MSHSNLLILHVSFTGFPGQTGPVLASVSDGGAAVQNQIVPFCKKLSVVFLHQSIFIINNCCLASCHGDGPRERASGMFVSLRRRPPDHHPTGEQQRNQETRPIG